MTDKLSYITPEERKMWETADMPIENYYNLAATICASAVSEYRDHCANMVKHYLKCGRLSGNGRINTAEFDIEFDHFATERALANQNEQFFKSDRYAIFTSFIDDDSVEPEGLIRRIRDEEGVTNYILNYNPKWEER